MGLILNLPLAAGVPAGERGGISMGSFPRRSLSINLHGPGSAHLRHSFQCATPSLLIVHSLL